MLDDTFKDDLFTVFKMLDLFIEEQNRLIVDSGGLATSQQVIKIAGQTALLLSELPFSITATMDLDVVSPLNYSVSKKLAELLIEKGIHLETDGHLIWMPAETEYTTVIELPHVQVQLAKSEFVIASKFKFKRPKDQKLIKTYLEHFPDSKDQIKKLAGK